MCHLQAIRARSMIVADMVREVVERFNVDRNGVARPLMGNLHADRRLDDRGISMDWNLMGIFGGIGAAASSRRAMLLLSALAGSADRGTSGASLP